MEKPYEQVRRAVKLFECNKLRLHFANDDVRAQFIDRWAEEFAGENDTEWNIAVVIMTSRRREPNMYNMKKSPARSAGHKTGADTG